MIRSVISRRIPALLLCAVMIIGVMSQGMITDAVPVGASDVAPDNVETVIVPVGIEPIAAPDTAETEGVTEIFETVSAPKYAEDAEPIPDEEETVIDIQTQKVYLASGESTLSYNLGIIPKGTGTVNEDWNSSTRMLTLTAVAYPGCSFLCWSELYVDETDGKTRERMIQDSDPYNTVYRWYVAESGRTVVANFKRLGEYAIWNATTDSEGGILTVTPDKSTYRPGTTLTLKAKAFKDYEVLGIEYGYAVGNAFFTTENVEWQRISDTDTATMKMPASDIWVRAVIRSTLPHRVKLVSDQPELGSVTFSDGTTEKMITPGTTVTLTVTPIEGYHMELITGVPAGFDLETRTFEMVDHDLEMHVKFSKLEEYTLSVICTPRDGDASLLTLAYYIDDKTGTVIMMAVPKNNSIFFDGWYDRDTGVLLTKEMVYKFIIEKDTRLEARAIQGYAVIKGVSSYGTLAFSPDRSSDPSDATKVSYSPPGEVIKLMGTPNEGYIFKSFCFMKYADIEAYNNDDLSVVHDFEGDTFTMISENVVLMARYARAFEVTATPNDPAAGNVYGGALYEAYTKVTLTAEANEGYEFVNWTENGMIMSMLPVYQFDVGSDRELVANFRKLVKVTVTSSNDAYGTVSGGGTYDPGSSVTVTATPLTDCVFINWTKNGEEVSTSATYTFTAQENVALVANFRPLNNYTVTVASSDSALGSVSGGGTVREGNSVTVEAVPAADCLFLNWTKNGLVASMSPTYTFTPDANVTLTANFRRLNDYTVTVVSSDSAYGSVSGGGTVKEGNSVTVTATPATDCYFINWTKDGEEVSTSASYTFTPDCSVTLTANFDHIKEYNITVTSSDTAYGTVSGGGTFKTGESVTVRATPETDCLFINWTKNGVEVSKYAYYTFTAQEDVELVANFRPLEDYTVTVVSSNSAYGSVYGGRTIKEGDYVTVIATPATDCYFVSWTIDGTAVSTSVEYTFKPDGDVTLTANFEHVKVYTVKVTSSDTAYGSVTGGGEYNDGTDVTVTATPADDCCFVNWTAGGVQVSSEATYEFTVNSDIELVANFRLLDHFIVSVSSNDEACGTVTGGGTFKEGSSVTVKATAEDGFHFVGWREKGATVSTDAEYTFTADADRVLVAIFANDHSVTVTFEIYPYDGTVDPDTLTTDTDGQLPYIPVPVMKKYDFEFWYYAKDGKLYKVDDSTVFTKDTRVLAYDTNERAMLYDLRALADQRPFGIATADKQYAEFGTVVNITATPNPGFKFLKWWVFGDETGVLFGDPYSPTTTYIRGLSGDVVAVFDYDFPKRDLDIDMPEFMEKGQTLRFTATITADAEIPQDINKTFYTLDAGYRTEDGSAGAPLITVLSVKIEGNVCVAEYEITFSDNIKKPFEMDIEFPFGSRETGSPVFHTYIQLLDKVEANEGASCQELGTIAYWICETNGKYYADPEGRTEITLDDVPAYGPHHLKKVEYKAPTGDAEGNIEYYVCEVCGEYFSDPDGKNEIGYKDTVIPKLRKFTVRFVDDEGKLLQSKQTVEGETPVYENATPTKEATAQYTYTFAGWTPGIAPVTGDATYTAKFSATVNKYTVRFVNEDGTELQSGKVAYGETPEYKGDEPKKDADAQYTYAFAGWTPGIASVTGDATYTAKYSQTVNEYTIRFVDEDGTELQSGKVAYGETPEYNGEIPTKTADTENTYVFAGWTPAIESVTGDATYTAKYSSTLNDYTVVFLNDDGTELQSGTVAYGETPEYKGETPVKPADAQYTYTFAGWKPGISKVTGDVTYTATYEATLNEYTVEFLNDDGTVLQNGKVKYGEMPEYKGETPEKQADAQYTYTFSRWDSEIVPVTGDATYMALYSSEANSYEVTFSVNGVVYTINMKYGVRIEAPADPEMEGYEFIGWFTDEECTVPADFTQPVSGSLNLYAGFEAIVYTADGSRSWDADNAKDLRLTIHRSRRDDDTFDLFRGLTLNGAEVDPSYYTAEKGSLILTLKSELFKDMPEGKYELVVLFEDGEAETELTVERKAVTPPTGESVQLAVCLALALSSLSVFAVIASVTRRKKAHR
ncbi:MAG: InlB B-repeat-containing protein [Clostridia bacterium]|nr:InlB B-repeat-containing protein [Clostridia bacterium]